VRSASSMKSYGENINVLLRPDSAIVVVHTALGYLITYSLATDPSSRLYHPSLPSDSSHSGRRSLSGKSHAYRDPFSGPGECHGIREVSVRFRMVIKVDAGISTAIALDDELMVATEKPPALQCVRWAADESGPQATTTLLKSIPWVSKRCFVSDMVYDRPMNISTWITNDGNCYAVQKNFSEESTEKSASFTGHCFHRPESAEDHAVKAAINARFSLIAVGCSSGNVFIYTAKDYAGHIPLSHKLTGPVSSTATGSITCISCSPDGYSWFIGYENGWMMWSVYGKLGASSFSCDQSISNLDDESWLTGVKDAFWIGGGCQLIILGQQENRLWSLDLARSAVVGCFSLANISRPLLQTETGFMIYRGYDLPDLGTISLEAGLWHHVQIPAEYLHRQWPIRSAVISTDGRYIAVAGRRGLAHYSVTSGRWRTFEDTSMEEEFAVRGGMCWHQHVLIAAVESSEGFQVSIILIVTTLSLMNNVDSSLFERICFK
jgi:RAB6A-GEF complex partner protein 1